MTGGSERADEELLAVAEATLPGQRWHEAHLLRGSSHDELRLPGAAVLRVARTPAAATALPRRTELLRRLARLGLPFEVPEPLSEVVTVHGRGAVALSWMYGRFTAPRIVHSDLVLAGTQQLSSLLGALREVDCGPLADVLGVPHEGVGGDGWAELMLGEVVPRLPRAGRREARRRITKARDLPVPRPSLVHGALDASNLLWDGSRRLVGVLGWDAAQLFDPALDAAWLLSQKWGVGRVDIDRELMRRTRIRALTLGFEPMARAILDQETEWQLERRVARTVEWLEQTTGYWSREALRAKPFRATDQS
ncbi:phosphotransferase [Kitasatospora paracochleata]|uniref:Aminoglycoside phosphotransferase (APT) family kinase protein n=1 Tax=Kitasatospora paracochleata TaxID=58354 RepID=A0ABT1J0J6_9ACTN|nr:phosphotransferase [Kitasatospora paracochleata]MCP2310943.1 aminoglycoside phosphotransferase (APT) family kinase protein [Kitasatospora paracochleata]